MKGRQPHPQKWAGSTATGIDRSGHRRELPDERPRGLHGPVSDGKAISQAPMAPGDIKSSRPATDKASSAYPIIEASFHSTRPRHIECGRKNVFSD